jgi:hypothetical protein
MAPADQPSRNGTGTRTVIVARDEILFLAQPGEVSVVRPVRSNELELAGDVRSYGGEDNTTVSADLIQLHS